MTTSATALPATAQPRSFVDKYAWFWAETVLPRIPLPSWLVCLLMAAALYGMGAAVATAFGELHAYVRDPHFTASFPTTALIALYVAQMPKALDTMLTRVQPYLSNSPDDIDALRLRARRALTRIVLPSIFVWIGFATFFVVDNSWGTRYEEKDAARLIVLLHAPLFVYFYSLGFAFGLFGVAAAIREITRTLDFTPGVFVMGGRSALKPFTSFVWLLVVHLLAVTVLLSITNTPLDGDEVVVSDIAVWITATPLWFVILFCERSIDSVLAREKSAETKRLREAVNRERDLAQDAESIDVLRGMQRTQVLLYELQRTESFATSLIDLRFAIQVSLSITATIIANVILRTAISGLLD